RQPRSGCRVRPTRTSYTAACNAWASLDKPSACLAPTHPTKSIASPQVVAGVIVVGAFALQAADRHRRIVFAAEGRRTEIGGGILLRGNQPQANRKRRFA